MLIEPFATQSENKTFENGSAEFQILSRNPPWGTAREDDSEKNRHFHLAFGDPLHHLPLGLHLDLTVEKFASSKLLRRTPQLHIHYALVNTVVLQCHFHRPPGFCLVFVEASSSNKAQLAWRCETRWTTPLPCFVNRIFLNFPPPYHLLDFTLDSRIGATHTDAFYRWMKDNSHASRKKNMVTHWPQNINFAATISSFITFHPPSTPWRQTGPWEKY